jgi:protein phosphatase methylesterase 1
LTKVTDAEGSDAAASQRAALDLSLSTLSADLIAVLEAIASTLHWSTLPSLVLVGHSLGGAVITDVAHSGALGDRVLGYAVLDVVEGSAIDALASMQTYLATRPSGFAGVKAGIEWHLRTRTIRSRGSAKVSVPGLLRLADEKDGEDSKAEAEWWVWKTDLAATQPFWEGWFAGLSKKFLEARGGKLLLLAGTDRLDKELMIGHMQGMYSQKPFRRVRNLIGEL